MRIAVLGGGITGVTLASRLETRADVEVTLFEADAELGGLCRSVTVDGFTADLAGGHILYSKDGEVLRFLLDALGPDGAVQSQRRTRIHHSGRLVTYPFENGLGDLDREETFECLRGYIDAWVARRFGGSEEPANFEGWCRWRFGDGISRLFMLPYNRKIWKVDLRALSTGWVRGRVPDAPMEDVLRSALGIPTVGYGHQALFHYPRRGGFQALVRGLTGRLRRTKVRLRTPVAELTGGRGAWRVNGESFDRVVSTVPLPLLGRILRPLPEAVESAFRGLRWRSLITLLVALRRPPRREGLSWVYLAADEDGPMNRITFLSNYSPENAPPGCGSILAEVTHDGSQRADDLLSESVVAGLVRTGMCEAGDVLFTRAFDVPFAYILNDHDHDRHVTTVREHVAAIGLAVAGRFGNYNYYNSDQCVREAMDVAEAVLGETGGR